MVGVKRLVKGEGYGNVYFEEVPVPTITENQVLVRTHTSLISRGSEILRRYRMEGPVDPKIMGYSVSGTITQVGEAANDAGYKVGDRVFVSAPHAEYVVGEVDPGGQRLLPLPAKTPWHRAPFQSLARGAAAWQIASRAKPGDVVVVLGQGLIGNLVMQAHRLSGIERVIAVDTLELRLELARNVGADTVIDASSGDAVEQVRRLTAGKGADVVVDCVGGPPGLKSFESALEIVKSDGIIHLIGLYHPQPLALDSGKIQRKMLIGGYHLFEEPRPISDRAAQWIASGAMQVDPLITHRLPAEQAPEAFSLLDTKINEAHGVLLEWPQD